VTKQFEELAMITSMSGCKPINEVQENEEFEDREEEENGIEKKEEAKKSESGSSNRHSQD
jgi:hypothetical protein